MMGLVRMVRTLADRVGVSPGRLVFQGVLLVVSAVTLYVLAPELLDLFSAAPVVLGLDWLLLALMVVTQGVSVVALALLVRAMLPRSVSWVDVLLVQLTANAVTLGVPGGAAAGAAVSGRLFVRSQVKTGDAAAALTASSLLSTLTVAALAPVAGVLALLQTDLPRPLELGVLIGTALGVALVVASVVLLTAEWPLRAWDGLARGLDALLLRRLGHPLDTTITRLRELRRELRDRLGDRWKSALGYSAANWLLDFATLALALAAVGAEIALGEALLAFVVVAVLRMIPITPGGLGFVEGGLTSVLTIAGMASLAALVVTLAYRAVSLWLALPVGLVAYVVHRRRHPVNGNG